MFLYLCFLDLCFEFNFILKDLIIFLKSASIISNVLFNFVLFVLTLYKKCEKSCYIKNIIFIKLRGGSRTAATSKMERFVIIVNGWKPLTIITKRSILDVASHLDPPLKLVSFYKEKFLL